eukprot:363418-Chlamydomonas_euryale.AAC.2
MANTVTGLQMRTRAEASHSGARSKVHPADSQNMSTRHRRVTNDAAFTGLTCSRGEGRTATSPGGPETDIQSGRARVQGMGRWQPRGRGTCRAEGRERAGLQAGGAGEPGGRLGGGGGEGGEGGLPDWVGGVRAERGAKRLRWGDGRRGCLVSVARQWAQTRML